MDKKSPFELVNSIINIDSNLNFTDYCDKVSFVIFRHFGASYLSLTSILTAKRSLLSCYKKKEFQHPYIKNKLYHQLYTHLEAISFVHNDKCFNSHYFKGLPIFSSNATPICILEISYEQSLSFAEHNVDVFHFIQKQISSHFELTQMKAKHEQTSHYLSKLLVDQSEQLALDITSPKELNVSSKKELILLAHELTNPIDIIVNSTNKTILTAKSFQQDLASYIDEIDEQTKSDLSASFTQLYNSLLCIDKNAHRLLKSTHSILKDAHEHTSFRVFNLKELIQENLEFSYQSSKLSRSNIHYDCKIDVPTCLHKVVFTNDVSSLFVNLFNNAFESIYEDLQEFPDKVAFIEIQVIKGNKEFEIIIKDNGKGMDEEELNYINEDFFTTKDSSSSTGVGLSIVRDVLFRNRGVMKLKSRPHMFTAFKLHFPFLKKV